MSYDWEGTRTRRIRKFKICLAAGLPIFIIGLGAMNAGLVMPN